MLSMTFDQRENTITLSKIYRSVAETSTHKGSCNGEWQCWSKRISFSSTYWETWTLGNKSMAPQAEFWRIFPFKVSTLLTLHSVAPDWPQRWQWGYEMMLAGKDSEAATGPCVPPGASRQISPSLNFLPRKARQALLQGPGGLAGPPGVGWGGTGELACRGPQRQEHKFFSLKQSWNCWQAHKRLGFKAVLGQLSLSSVY